MVSGIDHMVGDSAWALRMKTGSKEEYNRLTKQGLT
jgi:hypothetical protein